MWKRAGNSGDAPKSLLRAHFPKVGDSAPLYPGPFAHYIPRKASGARLSDVLPPTGPPGPDPTTTQERPMRYRIVPLSALACILTAVTVVQGAAQTSDFPSIAVGQSLTGTLPPGNPTLAHRGAFTVYRFDGEAGARYEAELRSEDFDAYIIVARLVGGVTEFLHEDDDSGGDSNARVRFALEAEGPHLLIVQAWGAGTGGAYTLTLEERSLPGAQPPREATVGEIHSGSISDASSILLTDWGEEILYDLWTLDGRGDEEYMIALNSSDFDAYLEFGPMSGDNLTVTDTDDDGGDGLNSLLRVRLPHDGRFGIRARPLGQGSWGDYTLEILPFTAQPALRRSISLGESVTGTFTPDGAVLSGGIPYHEWIYAGTEGERLRIAMRSEELDSYLSFGRENAMGDFEELTYNDDAPDDGVNALIEYTLTTSGSYVIRARTYGSGSFGEYTLEVMPE